MLQFQSRFLEDAGEASLEPAKESSENCADTETMRSVLPGRGEPYRLAGTEVMFDHLFKGNDREVWDRKAGDSHWGFLFVCFLYWNHFSSYLTTTEIKFSAFLAQQTFMLYPNNRRTVRKWGSSSKFSGMRAFLIGTGKTRRQKQLENKYKCHQCPLYFNLDLDNLCLLEKM